MARTVWEKTITDCYLNILKIAREEAFRQANAVNIVDIKGHGHRGMNAKVWDGLVDIWLSLERHLLLMP